MTENFPAWLKAAREEAGLAQWQVGEMAGVSTATICRWEKGNRAPPHSARVLLKRVLGRRKR